VGADGLLSSVRRWVGLDGPPVPERARRFGVRRHYTIEARSQQGSEPGNDLVEVHWTDGCEAYVTPVGPKTVGVAMLWRGELPDVGGFDDLLSRFPRLMERLEGAATATRDRGCGPLAQRVRAPVRGRIALVGDASGYLDAITGEGLSLAFHQAEALADAIARCERGEAADLSPYARAHRRIRRLPEALIRFLLFVERRPALRRRVIRALAAEPALFDRILGIHARTLRPRDLGLGGALRIVRRMVA
jgi:flavin-dependent dehydrogenase